MVRKGKYDNSDLTEKSEIIEIENAETTPAIIDAKPIDNGFSIAEELEAMEFTDPADGQALTSTYKKFEVGEELRAIYLGHSKSVFKGKGENPDQEKEVVYFQSKKGSHVNANFVLVQALKQLEAGASVYIKAIGMLKLKAGETMNYEIVLLKGERLKA
jgi:hypothetical protein